MRNILSFNESKETLQGFFFDKLDWKFLDEFLSLQKACY